MSSVQIRDLHFRYGQGDFRLEVPELDIASGASLACVGPSGSGKSTFLERGRLASLLAILLVFSVVICVWSSRYQQGVDSIIRLGRRGGASLIAHSHHY